MDYTEFEKTLQNIRSTARELADRVQQGLVGLRLRVGTEQANMHVSTARLYKRQASKVSKFHGSTA